MKQSVRTIKITDRLRYPTPAERASLDSSVQRQNSLNELQRKKKQLELDLQDAEKSPFPNITRIARLRAAIQNMTGTLSRAQR